MAEISVSYKKRKYRISTALLFAMSHFQEALTSGIVPQGRGLVFQAPLTVLTFSDPLKSSSSFSVSSSVRFLSLSACLSRISRV